MIGECTLPWIVAFKAAKNLILHATTCCHLHKITSFKEHTQYAYDIHDAMTDVCGVILPFQRLPPEQRMSCLETSECIEIELQHKKRDKVYSFLGLVRSSNSVFRVDYGSFYMDVCRGVVIEDIKASGYLNALMGTHPDASIRLHQNDSTLVQDPGVCTRPSWVIDGNKFDWWAEDRARILFELYKPRYETLGDSNPRFEVRDHGRLLEVTGKAVNRFILITDQHWDEDLLNMSGQYVLSRTNGLLSTHNTPVQTVFSKHFGKRSLPMISYYNGIMRTSSTRTHLLTSTTSSSLPSNEAATRDCFAFLVWWLSKHPIPGHPELCFLDRIPSVARTSASVIRATSGRRLFLIAKGNMALALKSAAAEDLVAVLSDGSVLFVGREWKRESKDKIQTYQLLGDCYVHGCIDGELVKDAKTDDWDMLVLRWD
jgi:hypothetical protein